MTVERDAALGFARMYVARGWPLLVCHPRSKAPIGELVPHAVHSATTDLEVIAGWLREHPDANLAVACGSPGPQVLDLDYPERAPEAVLAAARKAPRTASARTPRSGHAYFAGTDAGTVTLAYGELRGHGSYTMVPPSTHPTGKPYVWLAALRGPLPPVPGVLAGVGGRAGRGEHEPPVRRIVAGEGRHPYMVDFAVHLLRGGVTDGRRMVAHLRLEFELSCEPLPPPTPGYFEQLAGWAVESRIAGRERDRADLAALIQARNERKRT